jgi:hypothetical protein
MNTRRNRKNEAVDQPESPAATAAANGEAIIPEAAGDPARGMPAVPPPSAADRRVLDDATVAAPPNGEVPGVDPAPAGLSFESRVSPTPPAGPPPLDGPPNPSPVTPPIISPFDPALIRLGTDYAALVGGESAGLIVSLWNKPPKTAWFRVHPTNEVDVLMLDLSEKKPDLLYYVDPAIRPYLATDATASKRLLVQVQTSSGVNALWAIKLGGLATDRANEWTSSILRAKELGKTKWIRVQANQDARCYETTVSTGITVVPRWPDEPFARILEIVLKDRCLFSLDDPVIQELLTGAAGLEAPPPPAHPLLDGLKGR